jgi:hypothetical protein
MNTKDKNEKREEIMAIAMKAFAVLAIVIVILAERMLVSDAKKRADIDNYEILSSQNAEYKILDKSSMPKGDDLSNFKYTLLVENNGVRSVADVSKDAYIGLASGDIITITKAEVKYNKDTKSQEMYIMDDNKFITLSDTK